MKKFIIILLLPLYLLSAKYYIEVGKRPYSAMDRLKKHNIADMKNIPQNTSFYAKQIIPMSWQKQLFYDRDYNRRYFAPWSKNSMGEPMRYLNWQVRFVQRRVIYNYYKKIIKPKIWKWWIKNSNLQNLDTVQGKAISIKHTNLRAFPTTIGAYRNPWKSTQGFPFDYNQNSELHINVPLYISHYSIDKKWAFVHAGHAFGWVKMADIALVNNKFIQEFKSKKLAVSVKDNLYLKKGNSLYTLIKLGTIFPFKGNQIYIATKNSKGFATLTSLKKPSNSLIAPKPIKFNAKNVAYVSQQFRNEPYGWGGKLYCRDCSSTTRDFFAPFGIYLKRNSADQAKRGSSIRIKGMPKAAKKRAIIKYAKPFRSLLYVPGHIVLYLGSYKGEPVVMHTYWGIRLKNWDKYTLSRTIISTTEPGKEHPQIREKSKLINSLQEIINF